LHDWINDMRWLGSQDGDQWHGRKAGEIELGRCAHG